MKLGKIILLFQAVVVLIIGFIFLSQLLTIQEYEFNIMKNKLNQGEQLVQNGKFIGELAEVKQRYTVAGWLLPILAIIEIAIISRALR